MTWRSEEADDSPSLPEMQQPQAVEASACGKTILVGEHAAVYGASAVAIPLHHLRLHIELNPIKRSEASSPLITLKIGGKDVSERVGGVVYDACQLLKIKPFPAVIRGTSALPIGAGLGSSATLCVGILRALLRSVNRDMPVAELACHANELEARFHGNPSGLDVSTVAYECGIHFAKGQVPCPIAVQPLAAEETGRWPFALIDSGIRASTLAMVTMAAPFFKTAGDTVLTRFNSLAQAVRTGLAEAKVAVVAEAMGEAGQLLDQAGVVNSHLHAIIDACLGIGALAAKSTGAGGGGAVLTLLDPGQSARQLQKLREIFGEKAVFCAYL